MNSRGRAFNIPQAAVDTAWDLVEELVFDRAAQPHPRSRTSVAKAVGVTMGALQSWEEGQYLPGLAAFVAWADACGYDVQLTAREE